jgi:hypothetical protein
MPYALMQKELITPQVHQLTQAFRVLPALTELDAHTVVKDSYGILLRGLELEDASALQDALFKQGIETEAVEEADLPVTPPAKLVKQVEFLPAHLCMYDPMGRTFTLAWQDVLMIAAGNVLLQEFRKAKTALEEPQFHGSGISYDTVSNARVKEEASYHLMLEIVLAGGISRYSILGDDFVFNHLGPRLTESVAKNFALLIQELAQYAPHAGLNRGAFSICEKAEKLFAYPSKAAFFEEMTWMLWRIGKR